MHWLLAAVLLMVWSGSHSLLPAEAEHTVEGPGFPMGTQEVSLTVGYLLPQRLADEWTTKQSGPAVMPSWTITITDPVGKSWYRGQFSIGAEVVYLEFREPVVSHGIGFTPKLKWTWLFSERFRPYFEFAGGPFWTDLTNQVRIKEQDSQFNFIVTAGLGLSWFITKQTALNIGYRFQHISNAGTNTPNMGLNASLPFAGFSFYY